MKSRILLLLATIVGLGSCTSIYKSGQTPDDVYYSSGQEKEGYVQAKNNRDNYQPYNGDEASDNYLRMKVKDPSRWSTLDYDMYGNYYSPYSAFSPYGGAMPFMPYAGIGYGGYYNPFGWNSYLGYGGMYFGNYYNPYSYFGGFNPYYYGGYPVVIVKPGSGSGNPYVNGPRVFNLNGYGNSSYLPPSGRNGNINKSNSANLSRNAPIRVFGNNSNNNNNSNSSGNYLRGSGSNSGRSFSPSNSNNNTPARTFEPRNNSSSSGNSGTRSGGGGGGGSAPVRSFPGRK